MNQVIPRSEMVFTNPWSFKLVAANRGSKPQTQEEIPKGFSSSLSGSCAEGSVGSNSKRSFKYFYRFDIFWWNRAILETLFH